MDQPPVEEERIVRIRQARQVLAGSDVRPPGPSHPPGPAARFLGSGSLELRYLVVLAALVLLGALVWFFWGVGPASPILFVLAVGLLLAWFIL